MANMIVEKSGTNFVLYTNGAIMLKNVRLSYPHVDRPYKGKDAKPEDIGKYSVVAMLPKETHGDAKDVCKAAVDKLLKDNKATVGSDKKFIRNGDDSGNETYVGHWTVKASEQNRPPVRDRRTQLVLDPTDIGNLIYGGCYANVLIRPWFQNNIYGKRVNAGLLGVQFIKDGDAFGEGRIDSSDAWEPVDGDYAEDDDDL